MNRRRISKRDEEQCMVCYSFFDIDELHSCTPEDILVCDDCYETEVDVCFSCNDEMLKQNEFKKSTEVFCYNCIQQYEACIKCDALIQKNSHNKFKGKQIDGKWYCEECSHGQFFKCQHCHKEFEKENERITYNEYSKEIHTCVSCSFIYTQQCQRCNQMIDIYNRKINFVSCVQGMFLCINCLKDGFNLCDGCGNDKKNDDFTVVDDKLFCSTCIRHGANIKIDPQKDHSDQIYKDKVKLDIKFKKKLNEADTKQYIGVQIEIQAQDPHGLYLFVKQVKSNKKILLKRDISIDKTRGIQICTQPATFKYHLNGMGWQRIFSLMNKYDVNDTTGCGIHFHISKNNFNNEELKVLDYFVNNATKTLSAIGGRDYTSIKDGYFSQQKQKKEEDYGKKTINRFEAVNLTGQDTVELRFPKSTSKYNIFKKQLKMVHNICKLAKTFTFDDVKNLQENDLEKLWKSIIRA